MEKQSSNFYDTLKWLIGRISLTVWMIIASVLLLAFVVIFGLVWLNKDNHISLEENDKIELSPTQVRSIENIGEWEFLAISDEELIDTVRRGFFGDDELSRIYYGTLRLGVNLHEAKPGWIKVEKDTITATLPPIKLLDNDFIDEAKTQSFYEDGSWSEADRAALYKKAYQKMKQRCMNKQNIASAEQNAADQFDRLLRSMGYENVKVRFNKSNQ
ncbi:MAG: DUF4230 domain-containing protein [Prevotella sp.]|jgi:hypothetical protein|nr:DUF4230 domain-containing protein [Prevotella sp.]